MPVSFLSVPWRNGSGAGAFRPYGPPSDPVWKDRHQPATPNHVSILDRVAGWGCGPVPVSETCRMARFQTDSHDNYTVRTVEWTVRTV